MSVENAVIIGAGVCGVATALALNLVGVKLSIFELKDEPATIGGTVGLTPTAIRYLEHIGVLPRLKSRGYPVRTVELFSMYTGQKYGILSYDNMPKYGHRAMRVIRSDLLQAMLETLTEKGIEVQYSKKLVGVLEKDGTVEARFDDGTSVTGDILLGCDGVFSLTRMAFVEPDRRPIYTGIAAAYGFVPSSEIRAAIHFTDTSVNLSRMGALMTSYYDFNKTKVYLTAIIELEEQGSRDGWKVRGADQEQLKREISNRFKDNGIPCLKEMVENVGSMYLYPINILAAHGAWSRGRVLLLGDAAHAMPPQGESTGFAIEDGVLLSEIVRRRGDLSVREMFEKYVSIRRPRMEAALQEANRRLGSAKDMGWLKFKLREILTPWYLWWTQKAREEDCAVDVRKLDL